MTQRSRIIAATLGLLLLAIALTTCGQPPVAQTWPGLTLDGDTLYVISGQPQMVYMLDAETGDKQGTFPPSWLELVGEQQPKGVVYWSPVTVGRDLAFVGFADTGAGTAGLYAFDPETGEEQWNEPVQSYIQDAPTYVDGVVYVGDATGYVYAVDVETRSIKPGWPFQAESAIWASPLAVDGRVYVASMDHRLYCLDAESGQVIWDQKVGGAMAASPILEDGILYVGAFDGKLYALRADTGELVEGFEFKAGNWIWSEALMTGGQLYVTALDGKLYALEPATGGEIWSYDSGQASGAKDVIRAAPVEAGASVVVASESGRVIAVGEATDEWVWPKAPDMPSASIYTTPVVRGDTVYVVSMNGDVWTLNVGDGKADPFFSPPASE